MVVATSEGGKGQVEGQSEMKLRRQGMEGEKAGSEAIDLEGIVVVGRKE